MSNQLSEVRCPAAAVSPINENYLWKTIFKELSLWSLCIFLMNEFWEFYFLPEMLSLSKYNCWFQPYYHSVVSIFLIELPKTGNLLQGVS